MIDFKTYDQENPHIWTAFVKYAREAKNRGFKNYSTNGIFEIMRWHTNIEKDGEFKINNNYRPDYARKMMSLYPEFNDFFKIRELKAARD